MRDVADLMCLPAAAKDLKLQLDSMVDGPRFILTDAAKLRQILRVELPAEKTLPPASVPDALATPSFACLAPGQPECRVLIVEDQEENRVLLRQLLERSGFQVRLCKDGVTGVEAFLSWQPRFIWMDWRMPGMDGLEATRRIRSLPGGKAVKIAILSASVFQQDRDQVLAAGADDFVPKPLQFARIYDSMTKLLGVQFVPNSSALEETSGPPANMDQEALAALPTSLRQRLADAVVSLHPNRMKEAIAEVSGTNSILGQALAQHASRLHYTAILQALRAAQNIAPKETTEP